VGPGYCAGGLNQIEPIQNNSNEFDSNQTRPNFILSKHDLPKLENFEIKYDFEGFDERDNFLHRNFSRFETGFELKIWEVKV
jgi:hypothetical protein